MLRGMLVIMGALLVAPGVGLGAVETPPPVVSFADACGDNHPYVSRNGETVELPSTDRTPRFDLRQVTVGATGAGAEVRIETCSPIGAADGLRGWRSAYVTLPDDCQLAIGAIEGPLPVPGREAHVSKTCFSYDPDALVLGSKADERFDITLPQSALTVVDGAIVIAVDRAGLTGEAAAAFAPGTVWTQPRAIGTEYGATIFGGSFDTEGNSDSFMAPSGYDYAGGTGTLTL